MAVLSWVNIGNAANILQLLGVVMIISVAKNFLRSSENKKECRKLELRVETLEALIEWPTPCWSIVQQQQPWLEAWVGSALREAKGLIDSYRNGSVWFLVWKGRSLTQQFRDLRDLIDSCCVFFITLNACQFIAQAGTLTAPLFLRVEGNEGGATPTATVPSRDAEELVVVAADAVVPADNNAAADDGQWAGEDHDQLVN